MEVNRPDGRVRALVGRSYLPIGRLTYAGASGVSLLVATQTSPNLAIIGEYIYQVGFASAFATFAGLGLDRIMARRMSAGDMTVGVPESILKFRCILGVAVFGISLLIGVCLGEILVGLFAGLFVVSRFLYADLEAVWIGAKLGDKSLFAALVANGLITGAGIIVGSIFSSVAMMGFSSLGNIVALLMLVARRRLSIRKEAMPGVVREAQGISWSLLLAIVYSRVDLVILAALGVSLESVALYGIVTRIFDALSLIRGSLAQYESREISSLRIRTKARRLLALAMRIQVFVVSAALVGLVGVWVWASLGLELPVGANTLSLGMALAGLPLFFSHLPTTAMIYSDRRTHRLLIGSLVTCLGSIGLKWCLIQYGGLSGAILAIGAVEIFSCSIFYFLYWSNARSWSSFRIVWIPLLSGLLLTSGALALS